MANQTESYLQWVKERGGVVTLGEILSCPLGWAAEYRRFHSELRAKGYDVTVKRNGKNPSQNVYTLKDNVKFQFDESGQGAFA